MRVLRWLPVALVLAVFVGLGLASRMAPAPHNTPTPESTVGSEPPGRQTFRQALMQPNLEQVRAKLASDSGLAHQAPGYYPLHLAIMGGNYQAVLRVAEGTRDGNLLLSRLSSIGHFDNPDASERQTREQDPVAKALIEAGAELEGKDQQGFTPMHLAIMVSSQGLVEALIKAGARRDQALPLGIQPLELAEQVAASIPAALPNPYGRDTWAEERERQRARARQVVALLRP